MRRCCTCKKKKRKSSFYVRSNGRYLSQCRSCCISISTVRSFKARAKRHGLPVRKYKELRKTYRGRKILAGADPNKKYCARCGAVKSLSEFCIRGTGRPKQYCKPCDAKYVASFNWKSRLKNVYGISADDYGSMLQRQRGVCKICGRPEKNRRLAVDHDHKTGRVRGLLCTSCNRTLGILENNFDAFMEYLGKWSCEPELAPLGVR